MNRANFCDCVSTLRDYATWDNKLYRCGIDLEDTSASSLADKMHLVLCDFNPDWSYDKKLGIDWILEWAYSPDGPHFIQTRHGAEWELSNAGALYDFLVFMNGLGWED